MTGEARLSIEGQAPRTRFLINPCVTSQEVARLCFILRGCAHTPPHELRMGSRDVPDIPGPGPAWIGFAMPSVEAAAVALDQITRLHLNRPKGIKPDRSTLLLFHLTARSGKPDADQHLNADLSFDLGPLTSAPAKS